jgi:hypothetical protein
MASSVLAFRLVSLAGTGHVLIPPVDSFVVAVHSLVVAPGNLVVSLRPDRDVDTVFQCESVSALGLVLVALSGPEGEVLVPPSWLHRVVGPQCEGLSSSDRLFERPPRLHPVAFSHAPLPAASAPSTLAHGGKWLNSASLGGSPPAVTDQIRIRRRFTWPSGDSSPAALFSVVPLFQRDTAPPLPCLSRLVTAC